VLSEFLELHHHLFAVSQVMQGGIRSNYWRGSRATELEIDPRETTDKDFCISGRRIAVLGDLLFIDPAQLTGDIQRFPFLMK
jgi:hypothetical protein